MAEEIRLTKHRIHSQPSSESLQLLLIMNHPTSGWALPVWPLPVSFTSFLDEKTYLIDKEMVIYSTLIEAATEVKSYQEYSLLIGQNKI